MRVSTYYNDNCKNNNQIGITKMKVNSIIARNLSETIEDDSKHPRKFYLDIRNLEESTDMKVIIPSTLDFSETAKKKYPNSEFFNKCNPTIGND